MAQSVHDVAAMSLPAIEKPSNLAAIFEKFDVHILT